MLFSNIELDKGYTHSLARGKVLILNRKLMTGENHLSIVECAAGALKLQQSIPVIEQECKSIYVVLCTHKGVQKIKDSNLDLRHRGKIEILKSTKPRTLGHTATGDKKNIALFKATEGDVFRVTWGDCRRQATFYVVNGGHVHVADQSEVGSLYQKLGLDVPFFWGHKEGYEDIEFIDLGEWKKIS